MMNDVTLQALQELVQTQYKLLEEQRAEVARLQLSIAALTNDITDHWVCVDPPKSDVNAGEIF